MKRRGCLIVVSGPSGAGKGTVCSAFLKKHTEIAYSISATTRAPRPGEVDGVNYYFVEKPEFERMIRTGEFLEWAEVFGNYYGTPLKKIEDRISEGCDILLEIDTQGALNVQKRFPEGVYIFLLPPSVEELARRLRDRGTDDEASVQRRLASAKDEIGLAHAYTYAVVNDSVERAVYVLSAIVEAERARTERNKGIIDAILGKE